MAMISDEIERILRTFTSIIHPDDRADVEREVRTAPSEDRPYALEYRIVRADGDVAWVLERGQCVVESDGQVRLDGVLFDITERKRAEDVLRRREAEQVRIAELKAARARIIAAQDETRRLVAESLTNVARCSQATQATVRPYQQDGCVVVEVADDGVGGVNPGGGSGIRGLIDRVESPEGSFDVRSERGNGTRIRARIPLALAGAEPAGN
jgi:PAS fold